MSGPIWNRIRVLAQYPQTGVTLRNLYHFDKFRNQQKMIDAGRFLQKEMSVRLSRRTVELDTLKFGLARHPQIIVNRDNYFDSVDRILSHPRITTFDHVFSFKNIVKAIKDLHQYVVPTMSEGVLSAANQLQPEEKKELDGFLNGFYGSRIGVRSLMGQYIRVVEDEVGIIKQINSHEIFQQASNEVLGLARLCHFDVPEIQFFGDQDYSLTYIPSHLHYIYVEVLKNAVRATIEKHGRNEGDLPPVKVFQSQGSDDLIVKVSDLGGGFPRSEVDSIFSYSYTTVKDSEKNSLDGGRGDLHWDSNRASLAGLGYGVPLTKLYATYFGGDFQLIPYHGIGTDAIIFIDRLMNCVEKEY